MHSAGDKGWVKFHRQQWSHWVSTDTPYCRGYAWTFLYANANHQDNKICFEGTVIAIKRGELITSIKKLAETWGWSRHKVSSFLKELEVNGMIRQRRTSKYTWIAIANYDKYQRKDVEKSTARTSGGHQGDTNKNGKNNKNYKNKYKHPLLET